ncbi:MAG: hypothetical protein M1823_003204 [Watsoniomyces obsoletus]|nr:MAG: hypothetical protein M1823_003204 [Watsoniomyces obsoletus]
MASSTPQPGQKRKAVEWSEQNSTKRIAYPGCVGYDDPPSPVRPMPPSRERKATRPILKPFNRDMVNKRRPDDKSFYGDPEGPTTVDWPTLLDANLQDLASGEDGTKVEAYMTIQRSMEHYTNNPDVATLKDPMVRYMQFIQRDIHLAMPACSIPAMILATQAIKTTITFVITRPFGELLTEEFRLTVMRYAIWILEGVKPYKLLVGNLLALLGLRRFVNGIWSPERVHRCLTASKSLTDRVTGKNIRSARLEVYRALLKPANTIMAVRITDWLPKVLYAMISEPAATRNRACELAMEAAEMFGDDAKVSCAVRTWLETPFSFFDSQQINDNHATRFINKLNAFRSDAEKMYLVPRFWGVVLYFLRGEPLALERWGHLKSWRMILVPCFESKDMELQQLAHQAWTRYIYTIMPDLETSKEMMDELTRPIRARLSKEVRVSWEAKVADDDTGDLRADQTPAALAQDTLCRLLYITCRPGTPGPQLERCWEKLIDPLVMGTLIEEGGDVEFGIRILAGLFSPHTKRFDVTRALDTKDMVPDELPRLPSTWVRSNIRTMMDACRIAFTQDGWNLADSSPGNPLRSLWRNFVRTLAEAGSREVPRSAEQIEAIDLVVAWLRHLSSEGPSALGMDEEDVEFKFRPRMRILVEETNRAFCLDVDLPDPEATITSSSSNSLNTSISTITSMSTNTTANTSLPPPVSPLLGGALGGCSDGNKRGREGEEMTASDRPSKRVAREGLNTPTAADGTTSVTYLPPPSTSCTPLTTASSTGEARTEGGDGSSNTTTTTTTTTNPSKKRQREVEVDDEEKEEGETSLERPPPSKRFAREGMNTVVGVVVAPRDGAPPLPPRSSHLPTVVRFLGGLWRVLGW